MNLLELPIPEDPELEALYQKEVYDHYYEQATDTVSRYPHLAARVIAVWLVNGHMVNVLRGTIP